MLEGCLYWVENPTINAGTSTDLSDGAVDPTFTEAVKQR